MIYVYECEDCEMEIEVKQSMQEAPPESVECQGCGGDAHRIFQAPTIRYRGPGFTKGTSYRVPPKEK